MTSASGVEVGRPRAAPQPAMPGRRHSPGGGSLSRFASKRRDVLAGYAFISPAFALFTIFVGAPVLAVIALSLTEWDLFGAPRFIGLANYRALLADDVGLLALRNTFVFAICSMVLHTAVGLALALAVHRRMAGWLRYGLRTAYFFPFIVSWVAVSLMWRYMLDPEFGIVHYYAGRIGLDLPNLLVDERYALGTLILIDLWKSIGYTFIILLAGLQMVPGHLHEAAVLDGAGPWRRLWHVTLPAISPILFFVTVIKAIGTLQVFEPMYVITQGGPGDSTRSIVMVLYETAFRRFDMGQATTLAVVMLAAVMLLTLIQFGLARRWVHHE